MTEIAGKADIVVGQGGNVSYVETFERKTTGDSWVCSDGSSAEDSKSKALPRANGSGNYIVRNVFGYKKTGKVDVHSPQSKERWVMHGKNFVKVVVMLVALTVVVGAVVVATGHGFPVIAGVVAGAAHLCAGHSLALITPKAVSVVFAGVGSLIALFAILRLQTTVQSKPKGFSYNPQYTGPRGGGRSAPSTGVVGTLKRRNSFNPRGMTGAVGALGGHAPEDTLLQEVLTTAHAAANARDGSNKL